MRFIRDANIRPDSKFINMEDAFLPTGMGHFEQRSENPGEILLKHPFIFIFVKLPVPVSHRIYNYREIFGADRI